jgi:hypothetical protein
MTFLITLFSFLFNFQPRVILLSGDFDGDGLQEKAYLKTIIEKNQEETTALVFSKPHLGKWNTEKNCLVKNVENINGILGDEILISNLKYGDESQGGQFQILSFDASLHLFRVIASGKEPKNRKNGSAQANIIEKRGNQIFICKATDHQSDTLELLESNK